MAAREVFSSRFGFVMAAAGSAIGLGNVWGFPTSAAGNGGAAFVVAYFILAFCLAYPVLMVELTVGRYSQSGIVGALRKVSPSGAKPLGVMVAAYGVTVASLILAFYGIVAGWMIAYFFEAVAQLLNQPAWAEWLTSFGITRNIIFMLAFMLLTMWIVAGGVTAGIERWSSRLMPVLFLILVALISYVLTLPGAMEGLKVYLIPDFSKLSSELILDAMGQAFFSLSLGVGTMLIYGSYIAKKENLPSLGVTVTLVDTGVAFIAGLLILPTIYVAKEMGTQVFNDAGTLIAGPDLIFQVLPSLFESMGTMGMFVAFAFFLLMSIASLTSSISMLEVPVSMALEEFKWSRFTATLVCAAVITLCSLTIVFNFEVLFGFVIDLTTKYSQPILGLLFCIFAAWLWNRQQLIEALKEGCPDLEKGLFIKIWPVYIKFVVPLLIILIIYQQL